MPQPDLPAADLPKDNKLAARLVARACRKATLASILAGDGAPYASLVTVALDHDLAPILLLSALSDHSRNIAADARVSLLFDGTDGHPNPQTGPRVTLTGRAERSDDPRLRARFLAVHPGAALYAGFGDFSIWRVMPQRLHFVGGFGRAVWIDAPFGLPPEAMAALSPAEDAIRGQRLSVGGLDGAVAAWDCDGIDVIHNESSFRIAFASPAETVAKARKSLENLQFQGQS